MRQRVVMVLAFPLVLFLVKLMGDEYLRPLSISARLWLALGCCAVIALIALYGRRRALHR